jgi:hypothetical protein
MAAHDRLDVMVLYILPHGMLELTSIFVAAAAGLHLFWAWVAPGHRTRGAALAQQGRALATVAIGLVFALFLSGLVEGFVTGWSLPWPVKIGIGAASSSSTCCWSDAVHTGAASAETSSSTRPALRSSPRVDPAQDVVRLSIVPSSRVL